MLFWAIKIVGIMYSALSICEKPGAPIAKSIFLYKESKLNKFSNSSSMFFEKVAKNFLSKHTYTKVETHSNLSITVLCPNRNEAPPKELVTSGVDLRLSSIVNLLYPCLRGFKSGVTWSMNFLPRT